MERSNIFILEEDPGVESEVPEEQSGRGGHTDQPLPAGRDCQAVRRGREDGGRESPGARSGEEVEGGVPAGEEEVLRAGENSRHRGRQHQVPDQGRLEAGTLVGRHLVEAAQAGPVEIILYEDVEQAGADPVLGVVEVLPVVAEAERRQAGQ